MILNLTAPKRIEWHFKCVSNCHIYEDHNNGVWTWDLQTKLQALYLSEQTLVHTAAHVWYHYYYDYENVFLTLMSICGEVLTLHLYLKPSISSILNL